MLLTNDPSGKMSEGMSFNALGHADEGLKDSEVLSWPTRTRAIRRPSG
jgi:hypothetical protein